MTNKSPKLEKQFILRLPPDIAERVKRGEQPCNIEFLSQGVVKFRLGDQTPLSGQLMELPCIVETHKTLDGSNLFKSADIGQIIIISDELPAPPLSSGLTPPTRNIVNRRWRIPPDPSLLATKEREVLRAIRGGADQLEIEEVDPVEFADAEDSVEIFPASAPIAWRFINLEKARAYHQRRRTEPLVELLSAEEDDEQLVELDFLLLNDNAAQPLLTRESTSSSASSSEEDDIIPELSLLSLESDSVVLQPVVEEEVKPKVLTKPFSWPKKVIPPAKKTAVKKAPSPKEAVGNIFSFMSAKKQTEEPVTPKPLLPSPPPPSPVPKILPVPKKPTPSPEPLFLPKPAPLPKPASLPKPAPLPKPIQPQQVSRDEEPLLLLFKTEQVSKSRPISSYSPEELAARTWPLNELWSQQRRLLANCIVPKESASLRANIAKLEKDMQALLNPDS